MGPKPVPIEDRFWRHVQKTDGCWLWTGARDVNGYGRVSVDRVCRLAHRVAWKLATGTDATMLLCHRCDTPACVNPNHLFEGTQDDNMRDCAAKGRTSRGEKHAAIMRPRVQKGEQRFNAKLTAEQVRETRRVYADKSMSIRALARVYGVSPSALDNIISGKSWRSVTCP